MRASSWNQISIGLPAAQPGSRWATVAAKFFYKIPSSGHVG
jgi:hypothetical protein